MVATGVNSATDCNVILGATQLSGAMAAVSGSFMCVIGNLYSVMLAGAAGGFALMNYAWLGLGGGMLTWIAGLLLVLAFLVIGFDLFFTLVAFLLKGEVGIITVIMVFTLGPIIEFVSKKISVILDINDLTEIITMYILLQIML